MLTGPFHSTSSTRYHGNNGAAVTLASPFQAVVCGEHSAGTEASPGDSVSLGTFLLWGGSDTRQECEVPCKGQDFPALWYWGDHSQLGGNLSLEGYSTVLGPLPHPIPYLPGKKSTPEVMKPQTSPEVMKSSLVTDSA